MSKAQIEVKYVGDGKQVMQVIRKIHEEERKVKKGADEITDATKKTAAEQRKWGREAKKILNEIRTPQESHNKRVESLNRMLEKGTITQRQHGAAIRQSTVNMREAGSAGKSAFGSNAVGQLRNMVAGYLGVSAAIRMVTASIADKQEVEKRSRDFTITAADAQIKALRNLGPVSDKERADFIKQIQKLSAETKPAGGLATIYSAASTGLSSSGGNVKATMAAVRAAARIAPESPEEITAISGALLHVGKATSTQDAMKNLGFLLGVGKSAAVTSTEKIATNLSPAIIGVTGFGGTAREGASVVSALTQGMADKEGRQSGTAAISLGKQLREALPALGSTLERIRHMQGNPLAREEFLGGASFESKALIPIEQMLAGGQAPTAQFLEQALKAIPRAVDAAPIAKSMIRGVNQPFAQRVAGGQRALETGLEELDQSAAGRARAKAGDYSAENLDKLLAKTDMGWARRKAAMFDYHIDRGTNQEAFQEVARQRVSELRPEGISKHRFTETAATREMAAIIERTLGNMAAQFAEAANEQKEAAAQTKEAAASTIEANAGRSTLGDPDHDR